MLKTPLLILCLFSSYSNAQESFNIFAKREFNQSDQLVGVGVSTMIGSPNTNVKGELISSLNYATVLDDRGFMRDYLALDTGVRLGFYGQTFIYIEAGFDVFELVWQDIRDEEYEIFDDTEQTNTIDGYAGLGAGINTKHIRVEAFVKARKIDTEVWESDKYLFYGLQLSLVF
jgi:hypothetical protein